MFSNNSYYLSDNSCNIYNINTSNDNFKNDKFPQFGTKESSEYMNRTMATLQFTPDEIPLNVQSKTFSVVRLNSCNSCTRITATSSRSGGGRLGPP